MNLEAILEKYFGYTSFRPGQREVIEQLVNGKDSIALLPTGMGKSLCYQLPGYIFNKPVLIISPLLSLMQDQVDQMKLLNEKRVVALNSFLNPQQKKYVIHFLEQYRFIFISPEMLLQEQVKQKLKSMDLSLMVVDEAHCISQWGFDFRPDYLRIGEVINSENRPPVLALSATATTKVIQDIKTYLKMDEPFEYIHSVDRPNIHLGKIYFQHKEDKLSWISQHVLNTAGPGIIYTQSRSKTEMISERLIQQGIFAASYHGGKDSLDRQFIQQQFLDGSLQWIVATNAFGMGVHKEDVRQVIHESIPSNMANYMQEIGRAGRDGKDSLAFLLYAEGDEEFAKFVSIDDLPNEHHVDLYEGYQLVGDNPAQMVSRGELSETSFRVLDYWMNHLITSEVKSMLQKMKYEKIDEVKEVMKLIRTDDCMREQIVNYFGQTLKSKPEDCCTGCGMDLHSLLAPRTSMEMPLNDLTWKERLEKILIRSS